MLNIMQVVIYEHLQVLPYACIMFGFVVVQATVPSILTIMQVAIYEHLHLSWGSICLHNIWVSWWYRQLWPSILNIMQVAIYEHLHLSWGSICLHNIWFRGGTGNRGRPF